jgi:hypothetical protein
VDLERAAADAHVGAVRVERLHAQRQVWTAATTIIVIVAPARPFGVGTLSHPAIS